MKPTRSPWSGLLVAAVAAASAACANDDLPQRTAGASASTSADVKLIRCPGAKPATASAVIGLDGGSISAGGHALVLPAGAVTQATEFTLTVPESDFVEVNIRADGQDSFTFQEPVAITISYGRCPKGELDAASLEAWHVDTATREPLERMGGVDDKATRSVTFTTGHLTSYAIAN